MLKNPRREEKSASSNDGTPPWGALYIIGLLLLTTPSNPVHMFMYRLSFDVY